MPRYDYKVVTLAMGANLLENSLNEIGEEGWKLIAVDFESRRYIFLKERYHENNKTEN
jgi:hypothetical protein